MVKGYARKLRDFLWCRIQLAFSSGKRSHQARGAKNVCILYIGAKALEVFSCRISRGEIPCAEIYSDDRVLAFLDLNPQKPGHALVIPKRHYADIFAAPAEVFAYLFPVIQKVGKAVMAATGAEGLNVLQNNQPAAGQSVFHLHWHLVPRHGGDGLHHWPMGQYATKAEMAELAARIKACFD